MSSALERQLQQALDSRKSRAILRQVNEPIVTATGSRSALVDFSSNDYLSLSSNDQLRSHFLRRLTEEENILGSGGSRLLDGNTPIHFALETRLQAFFNAPSALLFNSGFDANVSIFTCLPQPGDAIVFDEFIHASVWDGCRASRASKSMHAFRHNSVESLESTLLGLVNNDAMIQRGERNVFIALESLYSMDGDFAPLRDIVAATKRVLPQGNGYIIADEAHATGLYGPQGRGIVALMGLESEVAVRLHTFGKALASNGAVVLCSPLIRTYLCNYARPLVFSTALSCSTIVSIGCSFDMLENGLAEKLSSHLFSLCAHFASQITLRLKGIPSSLLSLPPSLVTLSGTRALESPIIPVLTCKPRPLATYLQTRGYLARPITHPTVPKGQDRVRVCMHAGNSLSEVDGLIAEILGWAAKEMASDKMLGLPKLEAKL